MLAAASSLFVVIFVVIFVNHRFQLADVVLDRRCRYAVAVRTACLCSVDDVPQCFNGFLNLGKFAHAYAPSVLVRDLRDPRRIIDFIEVWDGQLRELRD